MIQGLQSRSGVTFGRIRQGWIGLTLLVQVHGAHLADTLAAGLDFPSNGQTSADVRFVFSGTSLLPMYPATYIWRVNLRHQSGYYTTFFWGPNGPFTGAGYYGAHPYPDGGGGTTQTHQWEVSINGGDYVTDANGHSTQLGYVVWRTQAFRAYDDGNNKVHAFYWDLPDTTKVIKVSVDKNYGSSATLNPALIFGDAPWNQGAERLSGILRGIQLYSDNLQPKDILSEVAEPLATEPGKKSIWYLNLNPTPEDISDKSGQGHDPKWVSSARAKSWMSTDGNPVVLLSRAQKPRHARIDPRPGGWVYDMKSKGMENFSIHRRINLLGFPFYP